MLLHEIQFSQDGSKLGPEHGLTVVTDTPEVGSQWLAEYFGDRQSLFVSFGREKGKVAGDFLNLGDRIFGISNGKFNSVDISVIEAEITARIKPVVVVQYPDLLLDVGVEADRVVGLIQGLLQKCRVIAILQVSTALMESSLPMSKRHNLLLTRLLHISSLVLTLRPFPTGRADDVTGVFRISAGPNAESVMEQEFLYTVGKEVTFSVR